MNKVKIGLIIFCISFIFISHIVFADIGVGIHYTQEELFLGPQIEAKCIEYSVYNPFSEDVDARVSVSDNLIPLLFRIITEDIHLSGFKGDPNDVQAKLENKVDVYVCFTNQNVDLGVYTGKIIVTYQEELMSSEVYAPLTIKVQHEEGYTLPPTTTSIPTTSTTTTVSPTTRIDYYFPVLPEGRASLIIFALVICFLTFLIIVYFKYPRRREEK